MVWPTRLYSTTKWLWEYTPRTWIRHLTLWPLKKYHNVNYNRTFHHSAFEVSGMGMVFGSDPTDLRQPHANKIMSNIMLIQNEAPCIFQVVLGYTEFKSWNCETKCGSWIMKSFEIPKWQVVNEYKGWFACKWLHVHHYLLSRCQNNPSVINPHSPTQATIESLWWMSKWCRNATA